MDGIMLGDFGSAIHYTKSLVQPDGEMKWSEVKWSELLRQKKIEKVATSEGNHCSNMFKPLTPPHTHCLQTGRVFNGFDP